MRIRSTLAALAVAGMAWAGATPADTPVDPGARAWRDAPPPPRTAVIYRDSWGVPHIHARDERDGFYGLGYAIAQDNLEDSLRQFIIGRGEMARHFGAAYVEIDRQYALLGVRAQAVAGMQRIEGELRQALESYVEGFRRYLADYPAQRPAWAGEFVPQATDLVGFSQFFTLMFPVNLMQGMADCRRGGVDIPSTFELFINLLQSGGPANASTAWAVAPWRTRDNVAIHLADPDNALNVPSPEFRLHAGDFEFAGYMVGMMMVGHSRSVAWGTTFGSSDVADCYAIELDPADPLAYRVDGQRRTMKREQVLIAVKDEPARTIAVDYATINGLRAPVVARRDGVAYAVVTPYFERAEGSLVDLYRMARARDLAELSEVLSQQGLFPVGITAADSSGNIGYFRVGRTPVRDDTLDWTGPVPGNTALSQWRGMHPFSDLVHATNPRQGYVRETNLAPSSMWGGDNPFHAPPYPRYVLGDAPDINKLASPMTRGQRADQVLSRTFSLTDEQAIGYVFNEIWPNVAEWQAAVLAAIAAAPADRSDLSASDRRLLQRVLQFDGNARSTSKDALAYHYWKDGVAQAADAAGISRYELSRRIRERLPLAAPMQAALNTGLRQAAGRMQEEQHWDAAYGDVFRIGRGGETFPIGGCSTPFESTLHTFDCQSPGHGLRLAVAGQKHVMLTVFSRPIRSYSWAAYGQQWRGRESDAHFNDQSVMTSEHRLKPTLFERADLLSAVRSKLVLKRTTLASSRGH